MSLRKRDCSVHNRGVIITPGALGDCFLLLPLAEFMKKNLSLAGIDMIGHSQYLEYMPNRSCIDRTRSIESIAFHKFFVKHSEFAAEIDQSIIEPLKPYQWIVSFLGSEDSDFSRNLNFALCCSHSAEVVFLPFKPADDIADHISSFYIDSLIASAFVSDEPDCNTNDTLITFLPEDFDTGRRILSKAGISSNRKIVLIHPGSGSNDKCGPITGYVALAEALRQNNIEPVFLLGPAECQRYSPEEIDFISSDFAMLSGLSTTEVIGVLACVDLFVGNDSGISHIAAGASVKTIALFGPASRKQYRPLGPATSICQFDNESLFSTNSDQQRVTANILSMLGI